MLFKMEYVFKTETADLRWNWTGGIFLNMIRKSFTVWAQAYDLKEEYRYFNRESTYELPIIAKKFRNFGINQFDEFADILYNRREEILNSFKRPCEDRKLSNSFTKKINGKIRIYMHWLKFWKQKNVTKKRDPYNIIWG